ncbi:hypothetical protein KHA90_15910 [Flavobacterium psychroterrae]|uniref:Uncharacterized protein n=1 Tax=Flavobacterium psychroterrae TaxID=2133767 RepID=A0ABS5PDY1_9FLAO|nr:hypothetical protein [Flavobacterium psychroterrae]MBS7232504.1 hypothetical protein [Flavobacterium psychroterrae]
MKKAALTFALISTVIVATSFETPKTNSSSDNYQVQPIDDGNTAHGSVGKRKLDLQVNTNTSQINFNQSEGFRQDRQSAGITKKMD